MFRNPFSFDGRIRRTEYGITFIIYVVLYMIAIFLIEAAGGAGPLFGLIILIPMVWFVWAQGAKRCHDIGKSGWMQIIPFYFFFLLFEEGEKENNEYGPNPKDPNQAPALDSETLDGHLRN